MPRSSTRQHRLPQRTDYALIPAPLDLALPLATEKSALPAIIVTPCSPSSSRDFSIAFLASPPKQSMRQRIAAYNHFTAPGLRLRAFIFVLIMLFVLVCHFVAHSLALRHSHFELSVQTGEAIVVSNQSIGWFDFQGLFARDVEAEHVYRDIAGSGALGLH